MGSARGPVVDALNGTTVVSGVTLTLIVALATVLISSPQPSAKEYRSREVTREFQREHPCLSTGLTTGACPATGRTTSCRSSAAAPCRFEHAMANDPRCQGEGPLGTKGLRSLGAALGPSKPPYRRLGSCTWSKPGAPATRATRSVRRIAEPVRRDRARLGGCNPDTTL